MEIDLGFPSDRHIRERDYFLSDLDSWRSLYQNSN